MGFRVLPPAAGSPWRLRCSSMILDRRLALLRGRHGAGSTNNSTLLELVTANRPKPRKRQSFFTRGSASRPRPRLDARTASQTSSHTAVRSTACSTNSRVNASLSSPITSAAGAPWSRATTSQPQISPLTSKPRPSRNCLTGKYRLVSKMHLPASILRGVNAIRVEVEDHSGKIRATISIQNQCRQRWHR